MTDRREKLEFLIAEYLALDKKLYIGHDIQTDVFDERQKILDEVGRIVRPRVDMILDFYKTLPKGEWCKSDYFIGMEEYCRRGQGLLHIRWINKGRIGYSFCIGEDDGYPETSGIGFEESLILEDSDEEVRQILIHKAEEMCSAKILELSVLADKEQKCCEELNEILVFG